MSWSGEIAVVGAYEYPERKVPGKHPFEIQAWCVLGALEDAGLALADVDGLATATGDEAEGGGPECVIEFAEYLGIQPTYFDSTDVGGSGPLSQIGHAANAIAAGQAEVVVVSYAANSYSAATAIGSGFTSAATSGPGQFEVPYGYTGVGAYALAARRHMEEFGTTREQLAEIAVACRSHASANPQARIRDPITIQDVLDSPVIADPLHRLDCCPVTDGGGAVVVTSAARAKDCRKAPAFVLGFGEACSHALMSQMPSFTETPGRLSGPRAFAQAGIGHGDVDVVQLYDSFTITALLILEDLGFCAKGEGGEFVSGGRVAIGGELPINTDGGGLSSNQPGRRGIFTAIESVRQLRGEGPGVQVDGCRIAVAHGSGGSLSAAATVVFGA